MSGWSYRSATPDVFELVYNDRHVADCWWIYMPAHPTVTMTRIIDRLNLPAVECAPSQYPVWTVELLECTEGAIPSAWGTFVFARVEVMSVVWQIVPARLDEWHQRIVDALNPGRGLPVVEPVGLPSKPQALFSGKQVAA